MFIEICFYVYMISAVFQLLWVTYKMKHIEKGKAKIKKLVLKKKNVTLPEEFFDVIIVAVALFRVLAPIHNTRKCIEAIKHYTSR